MKSSAYVMEIEQCEKDARRTMYNTRHELAKLITQNGRLQQENQQLKENYDRIYNENCKLREEHNITDISLLNENYKLKKQKDDVVEYIKKENEWIKNIGYKLLKTEDLLRMLGEIDE